MTDIETQVIEENRDLPLWARVGAELLGSFLVCFATYMIASFGSAIYGVNMAFVVIGTGLAYAVATLMLGKASGGQFNPAVTLAAMLTSKTGPIDGILYIVAQVLGGIAAGGLLRSLLPTSSQVTYKVWLGYAVNGFGHGSVSYSTLGNYGINFDIKLALIVEIIAGLVITGTAMQALDIKSTGKRSLAVGLAYALATAITFPITGAGLNPARSTGIAIFAQNLGLSQQPLQQLWVFWISPILAAAVIALTMIIMQLAARQQAVPMQLVEEDVVFAPENEDGEFAADEQQRQADGESETGAETTAATGKAADDDASEHEADAEVGHEQSKSQSDSNTGVKRD